MRNKIIATTLLLLLTACFLTAAIVSAGTCPSDDELRSSFTSNQKSYDELFKMIGEDAWNVSYIGRGKVDSGKTQLSAERIENYLKIARAINADFATQNQGSLIVWNWSNTRLFAPKSKYKGVARLNDVQQAHYPKTPNLDVIEKNGKDGVWVRPISGDWFLIYMQSD